LLHKARETDAETVRLQEQLADVNRRKAADDQAHQVECEALLAEIQSLRTLTGSTQNGLGGARSRGVSHDKPYFASSTSTTSKQIGLRSPMVAARTVSNGAPVIAPFSQQSCGTNVTLTEDGYTATRTRGCRQSVLIGSAPIEPQALGRYFEVEIKQVQDGWVGGLGIGVTCTDPSTLRRVPDKAWRIAHSYIVGYWGCVFLDGKERRTKWRVDTLPIGTQVGLLVSDDGSGDIRVFAGGELVVIAAGALAEHVAAGDQFFPVVDVFAATVAVSLVPCAKPPQLPWKTAATASLSPPGSPTGSTISHSVMSNDPRLTRQIFA
jgi:hypothetical protein